MKYKVGDRVVIKNNTGFGFDSEVKEILKKINNVATIKEVLHDGHYSMEELRWRWSPCYIKGLAPELEPESEVNRFELMDFEK